MKVKVSKTYTYMMKKDDLVIVDRFKFDSQCASGIKFRVIGVWKKPQWFDAAWFNCHKIDYTVYR